MSGRMRRVCMDINAKIEIHLSSSDVDKIIRDYFKDKYEIKDIAVKVDSEWVGYGPDEHRIPIFKEILVLAETIK